MIDIKSRTKKKTRLKLRMVPGFIVFSHAV